MQWFLQINIMPSSKTDQTVMQQWQVVSSFELDDLSAVMPFSKALESEMGWQEEFRKAAIIEYKKFALLSSLFPGKMVPSITVDTVWHLHLLYTRSYHEFCQKALGVPFLHHDPSKGNPEEEESFKQMYINTLTVYEEFFGSPPIEIWGGDAKHFAEKFSKKLSK